MQHASLHTLGQSQKQLCQDGVSSECIPLGLLLLRASQCVVSSSQEPLRFLGSLRLSQLRIMAPHARTSFLDSTTAGPSGDASEPLLSNTDQPSAPVLQQFASAPPDAVASGTSTPPQQDAKPEGTAYSLPSNYQPHYASEDMHKQQGSTLWHSHIMMFRPAGVPPGAAQPADPVLGIPAPQQPHEVTQPGYTMLASHRLGPDPIIVRCPYCGSETLSRVDHVSLSCRLLCCWHHRQHIASLSLTVLVGLCRSAAAAHGSAPWPSACWVVPCFSGSLFVCLLARTQCIAVGTATPALAGTTLEGFRSYCNRQFIHASVYSAQVNHIMLHFGVQIYMTTEFIQALPSASGLVGMKASFRTLLD